MPIFFLIGRRGHRAEFEVTVLDKLESKNQSDFNVSQISTHHTPGIEKQSHELQSFSNERYSS